MLKQKERRTPTPVRESHSALKNKYYISMMDNDGEYQLFVYDTKRGLWHKEDNTHVLDFCTYRGELYYIDAKNNKIMYIFLKNS